MSNKPVVDVKYYHVLFYCKVSKEGKISTYHNPQEVYAKIQTVRAAYRSAMPWDYLEFCDLIFNKGKGGFTLSNPNYYLLIDMCGRPFPSVKGMQYH